jgi:WD40 repeat protein
MAATEAQHTPELGAGDTFGRFTIRAYIGRGGFGDVYRAWDPRLGREVALKVMGQRARRSPQAEERFVREARTTATLTHPNIVAIYDRWDDSEGADLAPWVALELLPGGTLANRARTGPLPPREVLPLAYELARGLARIHEAGLVHRDIKPENLMLAGDGSLRITDFGLARRADGEPVADAAEPVPGATAASPGAAPTTDRITASGAVVGTWAYAAPEQVRGVVAPRADVWSAGVTLVELLRGEHPFAGHLRDPDVILALAADIAEIPLPAMPPRLATLLRRCLQYDPARRPTANELVEELSVLERQLSAGARAGHAVPFPGLAPFREDDSARFFGRAAEAERLAAHVLSHGTTVLVGPSGAGKTSLVQAGLLARLRANGTWAVLTLRPGGAPLAALTRAVWGEEPTLDSDVPDLDPVDEHAERLRADPGMVVEALRTHRRGLHERVLLAVDQLEELLTQTREERDRRAFLACIAALGEAGDDEARVLLCVREDFLGRLRTLGAADSGLLALGPPSPDELRAIVLEQFEAQGYPLAEPSLADAMIDEVADHAAPLPMIQFACERLWAHRDPIGHVIPLDALDGIGGVAGALRSHADAVVRGLSAAQLAALRDLAPDLVTGDGRARRTVSRESIAGDPDRADVVDALLGARLLHVRDSDGHLELTHDSLVESWGFLRATLESRPDEERLRRQVLDAAATWVRTGRASDTLWTGELLERASAMVTESDLGREARDFIEAGTARARTTARRRRNLAIGAVLSVMLVMVVTTAAVVSVRAQGEAARQAAAFLDARDYLEAANTANGEGSASRALALLRSAVDIEATLDQPQPTQAGALLESLLAAGGLHRELPHDAEVYDAAFSPDGRLVAALTANRGVSIWSVAEGRRLGEVGCGWDPTFPQVGTHDQPLFFDYTGPLLAWDATGRLRFACRDGEVGRAEARGGEVEALSSESCGAGLITGVWADGLAVSSDGTVCGGPLADARVTVPHRATSVSRRGDALLVAPDRIPVSGHALSYVDLATGQALRPFTLSEPGPRVTSMSWSRSGRFATLRTLTTSGADRSQRVHGALHTLRVDGAGFTEAFVFPSEGMGAAELGADDRTLWFGSARQEDGPAGVATHPGGAIETELRLASRPYDFDALPAPQLMAASGFTGGLWLFDEESRAQLLYRWFEERHTLRPVMSPDGGFLAVPAENALLLVELERQTVGAVATSGPQGRVGRWLDDTTIAIGARNGSVFLWDFSRREQTGVLGVPGDLPPSPVLALDASADGQWVVAGRADGLVTWWDRAADTAGVATGAVDTVVRVVVSPDGRLAGIGVANGQVALLRRGNPDVAEMEVEQRSALSLIGIEFTPDSQYLFTARSRFGVERCAVAPSLACEHVEGTSSDGVVAVALDPTGGYAVHSRGTTITAFDVTSLQPPGPLAVPLEARTEYVNGFAFDPSGRWLAARGVDPFVAVWSLDAPEAPYLARAGTSTVREVVFPWPEPYLLSLDVSGVVRLVDIRSGRVLQEIRCPAFYEEIELSPDRRHVLVPAEDGLAHVYRLRHPGDPMPEGGARTNLRVCRGTREVIALADPWPAPESVWAPEERCAELAAR